MLSWRAPTPTTIPVVLPVPLSSIFDLAEVEPKQIGLLHSPLSTKEKLHCRMANLCFYCGDVGHFIQTCPVRPSRPPSFSFIAGCSSGNNPAHVALPISFQVSGRTIPVQAIIDYGACGCFMNINFAKHGILLQPKKQRLMVHSADGSDLKSGPVSLKTDLLLISSDQGHQEFL